MYPTMEPHTDLERASDAELVRAGLGGDERAQRALFERHRDQVMLYCAISASRDPDRARDLAQEVWSRTFGALGTVNPEKFKGFLLSVTRNVCRTRGGQERRRRTIELLADLAVFDDSETVAPILDEDKGERELRIAIVQQVLTTIRNPMIQAIAKLKYCEPEHTTQQISELLGIPHGTVCVTLMRFRAAVRCELLAALLDEDARRER